MGYCTAYEKLIDNKNPSGVVAFYGRKISLNRVIKDIDAFAYSLKKLGLKRGDGITIYLPTTLHAIVAFYASSKLGITVNIVHPLMPKDALIENIKKTNSKVLLYYDATTKNRDDFKGLGITLIECSVADYEGVLYPFYKIYGLSKCEGSAKHLRFKDLIKSGTTDVEGRPEDILATMHSGGTDGNPKIVALSNIAFNALADNLTPYDKHNKNGDYSLVMLPIFHAFGLGVSVHTALVKKYNLCLMSKFSAKGANKYIRHYNISMIAGVPIMFKKMIEDRGFRGRGIKNLSDIWCGGDVLPESLVKDFDEKVKKNGGTARLMRGYGLTEVTGVCAVSTKNDYREGSSGRPLPNTDIKILDENHLEVRNNTRGEIAISTEAEFTNYIGDDSAFVEIENKKYVLSGDIGYIDDDGFLYVVGRIKRTIKINAINIFPVEVENIIRQIDGVKDVCVVDYKDGNKILLKSFVIASGDKSILEREIINKTKSSLIKYSAVSKVEFLESFPLTKIGKIDYSKLKEKS